MSISLMVVISRGHEQVTSQVLTFPYKDYAEQAKEKILEEFRESVWAVRVTLLEGTV